MDVKYNNKCYVNNVTSVLCRSKSSHHQDNSDMAAKIEFINMTESTLREGKPLNVAELEEIYLNILRENKVPKSLMQQENVKAGYSVRNSRCRIS